jgi:hypothetical protein
VAHLTIPDRKKKPLKPSDALDIAARYLVYKLHVPRQALTDAWHPLSSLGEAPATVTRAVERGWVMLREEQGRTRVRYAALTDAGRQVARKGLR